MSGLAALLRVAPFGDAEGEARLADLLDACGGERGLAALLAADTPARRLLAGIAAGSSFLFGLCLADPVRLARLLAENPQESLDAALRSARLGSDAATDQGQAMQALRQLKQEAALLIALADLGGVWDVPAVTAALTRVADAAVSNALRFLLRKAAQAGRVVLVDPKDPEAGSGFVVLAMGKHGAFELNYSSDIDLIVLYDPEAMRLVEGQEPAAVCVRITQGLVRMLSERTADGYVFRVDLRLRPDPGATAIAISLPAAFGYYESVGQNWERAAMIKARPCAGDIAAGERFLAGIAPFIWRKHLDYAAIADVHAMKRQIQIHKGHEAIAVAGHDLKLGRGGIREIEFFVQTQQLIAGGRNPALRGRQTLAMLAMLRDIGWIDAAAERDLVDAYVFLRAVEHRLQMVADEQTHRVPRDDAELARFARFCACADAGGFGEALIARLTAVQAHYSHLFEASPALSAAAGSLVFTGKGDDPETLETLARLGFQKPPATAETIRSWHFGRYPAMRSARAREDLTELTPALLDAFAKAGRPDVALAAFDGLLAKMPSGFQLLAILRNNPRLLGTLALILAVAPRLAELLATRPHALDGLLEPAPGATADEPAMTRRLATALAIGDGYEDKLDRARIFGRERLFVIGARLIAGDIAPLDVGPEISALAGAAVSVLLGLAWAELARVHGEPKAGRVVVLGMGKLGGRELTATSDLDLIVLYDDDPEAVETSGPRPIAPSAWFARLTQRLIAALSAPTGEGTLFPVDMRLRPSGRKGPVAIRIDGFVEYHKTEAWTWERMALTRARVVAGDASLAAEVTAAIGEILRAPRDRDRTLSDVSEMRTMIAKEKGESDPWNLKQAAGGIVDIEFIAQGLQLVHAQKRPAVLRVDTRDALVALGKVGALDADDCATLVDAWELYGRLAQIVRLCAGETFVPAAAPDALKALLAASSGLPDFGVLQSEIADKEYVVRRIFRKVIDRTQAEH